MGPIEPGRPMPVVRRVFDLKDAGKAQQEMLEHKNSGKIVPRADRGQSRAA